MPPPSDGSPFPDGPPTDANLGAWGLPTRFTALNSAAVDQDPTMTADKLEVVFASNRTGGMGSDDLWVATRASETAAFETPVPVPGVNSTGAEQHPWLSPDGRLMYFASNRDGNVDIYVTARATRTSPWAAPSAVPELNSAGTEQPGGLTTDLLTFALVSDRGSPTTGRDIYISTRATPTAVWGVPVVVAELASPGIESSPVFAGGGTAVYFNRDSDLYVVERRNGAFGAPRAIEELNTPDAESDPHVTEDQRAMLFSRDDLGGTLTDIYFSTR